MRMRNVMKIVFSFFVAMMFCSGFLFAQMTSDISASKDNTLYEDVEGTLSNGAGDFFFSGKTGDGDIRRALLAFNIAGNIPAGSTINSVTLTLNMSRTVSGDKTVSLHKILSDWGEGTSNAPGQEGGGAPATNGDATWLHTFFSTNFWTNVGGDFSTTASASQSIGDVGMYTWGSTPEMVADVQDWLDNPSNNFGWLVMGDESADATAKRFDTRENPTTANRPLLTVNYTPSTGIDDMENGVPLKFELAQNYPNPFNPSTQIRFTLNRAGHAFLSVYNNSGQNMATLVNERLPGGTYMVMFDGTDLSSGVYFYRLDVEGVSAVRKMLLIR
jgi:hypothetical protein